MEYVELMGRANRFVAAAKELNDDNNSKIRMRNNLSLRLEELRGQSRELGEELDNLVNAVALLNKISDDTVGKSYEFFKNSLNSALSRVFSKSQRQINLREYTRGGTHPQLEIEVVTEGGVTRSLKDDSGHGISQIISLLIILSIIVITGQRRFLVLDEMLSGLSSNAAKVVSDILWAFADIGFQFVISEHGLVVKGSHVYYLETSGGVSRVAKDYVERSGVYLDGSLAERVTKASTDSHDEPGVDAE